MYSESGVAEKNAISKSISGILQIKISECNGDQKKLFKIGNDVDVTEQTSYVTKV